MAPSRETNTDLTGWRRSVLGLGRPVLVLLLLRLFSGMMLSPHRTFFPVYLKELGHSVLFISVLATSQQAVSLLAALVGGSLSDLYDRKWTLLLGEAGLFLSNLLFLTPSLGWIAVLWGLGGVGMTLQTLSSQSYLMDAAAAGYLGVLTALHNWGYTLGGTLSSPVAGVLLDHAGYRPFALALLGLSVVTIVVNLALLPRSRATQERRAASLRTLFSYGGIASRPHIILMVVLRFLPTLYWGIATTLVPLLLAAADATKTTIALYAAVSQVAASLAQAAVGRMSDRIGAKWPTVLSFVGLIVGILGIGFLPDRLWAVFAFGALGVAAAWALALLNPIVVAQVTRPQERGRVLGWVHLWWNLSMIVGTMLGGMLFEQGAGLPFLATGVLNLPAIPLTFWFFRMVSRITPTQVCESP